MSRWANKYVIGLTGNIATGKSVVRQMLQHSGAYTIDADTLGHQAMMPGAPAYKTVVQTFGKFILDSEGQINRQMLAQIVFSNPEAMKKLEDATHPVIRQAIDALVKRSNQRVIVIEAIKLLDGDLSTWVDEIWVVNASKATQYKRLVGKRKMSEDEAKKRILAQSPQEDKVKKATVVVENDGDVEKTWKQVQGEWQRIKDKLTGGAKPAAPASPPAASAKPAAASPSPAAQKPAAASPSPAKAPEPVGSLEPEQKVIDISGMHVKRAMASNAAQIAEFINAHGKRPDKITRGDILLAFGEKSFFVAYDDSNTILAIIGWTVENLVTRVDELYIKGGVPLDSAVHAMVVAVEDGSKELRSEAAFIFLGMDTPEKMLNAFQADGYAVITLKEIKIPVWREAVKEQLSHGERVVLWKQLSQDRVLQPI